MQHWTMFEALKIRLVTAGTMRKWGYAQIDVKIYCAD